MLVQGEVPRERLSKATVGNQYKSDSGGNELHLLSYTGVVPGAKLSVSSTNVEAEQRSLT
jgi:hypothetical protein